MKKTTTFYLFIFSFLMTACAQETPSETSTTPNTENTAVQTPPKAAYVDLDAAAFKAKMKESNIQVLDVRTPGETARGIIDGAVEADIRNPATFNQVVGSLNKDQPVLIYCQSGGRSAKACKALHEMGFTELYNLSGGYSAWPAE